MVVALRTGGKVIITTMAEVVGPSVVVLLIAHQWSRLTRRLRGEPKEVP